MADEFFGTGPIFTPSADSAKGIAYTGHAVQDSVTFQNYNATIASAQHLPYELQNEVLALIRLVYGRGNSLIVRNGTSETLAAGPVTISGVYGVDSQTGNPIFTIKAADGGQDPANAILTAALAPATSGTATLAGSFSSTLDTSSAFVGQQVYLEDGGGLTLEEPQDVEFIQVVGYVQTLSVTGSISGFIQPPRYIPAVVEDEDAAFV